jgi:hypothetical protein
MKKAIKLTMLLLFAATLTTMVSCSKKNLYENRIVGRWECIYNSGGGGSGFEWLFRSDGVFITYDSHDLMCGIESSYSIKDDQLMLASKDNQQMLAGESVVYTIDELTSSSLVISINQKTLKFSKK